MIGEEKWEREMSRISTMGGISDTELKWRLMEKTLYQRECEVCKKRDTRVFYNYGAHYVCSSLCLSKCLKKIG